MRNEERNHRIEYGNKQFQSFTNINKMGAQVLSGVISRTHLLMLSTFDYAQKVRVFGSNSIFNSLCRQYYSLSNSVQRLVEQINANGVDSTNLYNNLTRLSEVNLDTEDDSFSELAIINKLLTTHQNILSFITDNFDITSSKINSETCSIIVERMNEHRHMIKELSRLKRDLETTLVYKGQLN